MAEEESQFKKKSLIEKIEKLMKYETAGDPITGILWTRKTRDKIAKELNKAGFKIGKTAVGKLLNKMNFSLKCNSKKISNGGKKLSKEEKAIRNTQFLYINEVRENFAKDDLPIISIDGKKKELIGNFKNPGTRLKKIADLVNDHDFILYAIGKAFPSGIYDPIRQEGFVYVGQSLWDNETKNFTSSETPEFGADNIVRWWQDYGIKRYPHATALLILADSGGSNSYRSRIWKSRLQEILCQKHGLTVTICHYPPGASKWNSIEHRLFSEISKNWSGTPLKSFETVLKYIRTTQTKTGLKVYSRLVVKEYKTGKSIPDKIFKNLQIEPHKTFPSWNYTLYP